MTNTEFLILSSVDSLSVIKKIELYSFSILGKHFSTLQSAADTIRFGGHTTVRENLLKGLIGSKTSFEFSSEAKRGISNIGLLAGQNLLRRISIDSNFYDSNVVVGPNVFTSPKVFRKELMSQSIKRIITPSPWVLNFFVKQLPELEAKFCIWPSGVDFDYWAPQSDKRVSKEKVLIYSKKAHHSMEEDLILLLKSKKIDFEKISYGNYSAAQYRAKLNEVNAVIYLGNSESQGLALLEAWAMNVPTFVYYSNKEIAIRTESELCRLNPDEYSPAPYLDGNKGSFWTSIPKIDSLLTNFGNYAPRDSSLEFSLPVTTLSYKELFNEF